MTLKDVLEQLGHWKDSLGEKFHSFRPNQPEKTNAVETNKPTLVKRVAAPAVPESAEDEPLSEQERRPEEVWRQLAEETRRSIRSAKRGERDEDKEMRDELLKELLEYAELEEEFSRQRGRRRYWRIFRSTVSTLVTVAAFAILVATLWLPVLQIYGSSMVPTLGEGDVVVSVKQSRFETGDIIAFYNNNKILVKRVIGQSGDWIDIKHDGTVYVNNVEIDEPYIRTPAYGECDIQLPYQVPEGRIFVMGDNRDVSIDSRSTAIGCVSEEQLVGRLTFCVWPLSSFGALDKNVETQSLTNEEEP